MGFNGSFYRNYLRMKIFIYILSICLLFLSCNHKEINEDNTCVSIVIDIDSQNEYLKLSEIFDSINIIPLQTLPECLIGEISSLFIDKNSIYILDRPRESIYIFSIDGNFIHKICNIGKGPGEYLNILDFFIDSEQNRIVLTSSDKIQFYSMKTFELLEEYPKKIFGVQYWYVGKNIFVAFVGNMKSSQSNHNLVFFEKNRIKEKYLEINSQLKGYNYSLKNNFSLKNDCDTTYFSLPFDSNIYQIYGTDLIKKMQFIYSRKSIPKKIWENIDINDLTDEILSKGYCYGEEDFFKADGFYFFKFRGEKKIFHCFMNEEFNLSFSNTIIDDLSLLPFQGFSFFNILNFLRINS